MLKYTLKDTDTEVEVTLQGDLDIEGTELMNEEILPTLLNYQHVSFNMKDVPFVDSSGMGLLINMVNGLKENNTTVKLFHISPDVMEVFELLQLPDILGQEVFS